MSLSGTVSPEMVRGVISTRLDDQDIESAISTAVNVYASKVGKDSVQKGLQIEVTRYLAAHFVSIHDPTSRPTREKIGDASIEYGSNNSSLGGGFLSSMWGQTAAAIDPTGKLLGGITVPPRGVTICK